MKWFHRNNSQVFQSINSAIYNYFGINLNYYSKTRRYISAAGNGDDDS